MNSSTIVANVSKAATSTDAKKTVPEMCLLNQLIAHSVMHPAKVRQQLQNCTPEQRAFLHTFFIQVAK